MTCPPKQSTSDRTVEEAISVGDSGKWWTGLVLDTDPDSGERRIRLERWVRNGHSHNNPHTWRVRPDYWAEEMAAITSLKQDGGHSPPGDLPIDERYSVSEYLPIRRDDTRRVVAVRLDRPFKSDTLRLYHFDPTTQRVRQKWSVGRDWERISKLATRHVRQTV